jgi:surface antigen
MKRARLLVRLARPNRQFLSLLTAVALLAGGCAGQQYATPEEAAANACSAFGPKALQGTLIGGAAGAAGGAALGAAAGGGRGAGVGALVGLGVGLLAGAVTGNMLDKRDCREAQLALQQMSTLPTGQFVAWSEPTTGSRGTFTATTAPYDNNGRVCRQIRADYYVHNHSPVIGDTGIICRAPNGDWARVAS